MSSHLNSNFVSLFLFSSFSLPTILYYFLLFISSSSSLFSFPFFFSFLLLLTALFFPFFSSLLFFSSYQCSRSHLVWQIEKLKRRELSSMANGMYEYRCPVSTSSESIITNIVTFILSRVQYLQSSSILVYYYLLMSNCFSLCLVLVLVYIA